MLQAKLSEEELAKLAQFLEIPHTSVAAELGANFVPYRGLGPMPPTDPVLYRLYEVRFPLQMLTRRRVDPRMSAQGVMVYGNAIKVSLLPYARLRDLTLCVYKAIIHEKVCIVRPAAPRRD